MPRIPTNAALLVIDVQNGFDDQAWGPRNNPDAEERIAQLLAVWRESGRPIIYVQHLSKERWSPLGPDQPGAEIKAIVAPRPGEPVIQKSVNSAFIGTDLEGHLRERGIDTLVVTGLTTDHCVSTTARMAGNMGFDTYLVADATATFGRRNFDGTWFEPQLVHNAALASVHGKFAEVLEVEDLVARL